jgi:glycosyltransferase involved in cell wall biosynthesis
MKKKIGFFNIYNIWGGGERWHFEMALHLKGLGHKVIIFAPKTGELGQKATKAGIEVLDIKWSKYSYFNLVRIFLLAKKLRSLGLDTLIFNSFLDVREAGISSWLSGIPKKVLRVGNPYPPKRKMFLKLSFLLGLDVINFISQEVFNVYHKIAPDYILDKEHYFYTNGVDTNLFSPTSEPLLGNEITVGNCARLSKEKGFKYFLDVAANFKNDEKIKFLIGGIGDEEDALKSYASDLGIGDKVKFVGYVEKPNDFYRKIDILLFTSEYEGTARTILECFSTGVPVVCFDISSMKELVSHEVDGLKSEPFNTSEMTKNLKKLINNASLRKDLGLNGIQKVNDNFQIDKVRSKWSQLILNE